MQNNDEDTRDTQEQRTPPQPPEKGKEAPDPMKSDIGRPERPNETTGGPAGSEVKA